MKPRSRGARWRRGLIVAALIVIGMPLAVGFVVVRTEWGRTRMKELAVQALWDELGLRASLGDVSVGLVPFEISARSIVLDDPRHGRFADAARLDIRPSLTALLQGSIDLETIHIVQPELHLIVRDGAIQNLPKPRDAPATSDGELPFGHILVESGKISVDVEPRGQANLQGVDLDLHTLSDREIGVSVNAATGRWDHALGSESFERLAADGLIGPSRMEINHLTIWTPHLKLGMTESVIPLPIGHGYRGKASVRVDLGHLEKLPLGWEFPETLNGILAFNADVRESNHGVVGEGDLFIRGVHIGQWGLGDGDLAWDLNPDRVRIREGTMRLVKDGGEVDVRGEVGLGEGKRIDLALKLKNVEFAKLMDQLGVTPNAIVQWLFNGNAELRGTLDPLDFGGPFRAETTNFEVTLDPWHAATRQHVVGTPRATLTTHVAVRPDGLRFENIQAQTARSRIRSDVLLGFDNALRVTARSSEFNLADASPLVDFDLAGQGSLSVDVTGTMSDPVVHGGLAMRSFAFDGYPFGDVESDFLLEKDGLAVRFPLVKALKHESRYTVENLLLDFSDDRLDFSGVMHAQRFTLADFYDVFHYSGDERYEPYQATFSGTTRVHFTRGFPGDSAAGRLTAAMDLDVQSAVIHGTGFGAGAFQGTWLWHDWTRGYSSGELDVERFTLRKGAGTVSISGAMRAGGVLQMTLLADGISLRDTEGVGTRLPDLGGIYSVAGDVGGTLEVPRARLDVIATGVGWRGAPLGDGRLYVRMTDVTDPWVQEARNWDARHLPSEPCARARFGLLHANWRPDPPLHTSEGPIPALDRPMAYLVCGDALDGSVAVDMAVGRSQETPLRGRIALRNLALHPFLPQAPRTEPVTGAITGEVSISGGGASDPQTLFGRVALQDLRVAQGQVHVENHGPVELSFGAGRFVIEPAMFEGPASQLRLAGGGSLSDGLALTIHGTVDLGLVASLSPTVQEASGRVGVRVNLSGPLENPEVHGEAQVRDGRFRFASFPEPVEDLSGKITFSERRILFENFDASLAEGKLSLTGFATIREGALERYRIDAVARGLSIEPERGVSVAFGGDLHLERMRGQRLPLLTGSLTLDRLLYTKNVSLLPTLEELSGPRRIAVEQYDPARDRVEIDLRVRAERALRVETPLIETAVRIEDRERPFRIVGTDQRFGVLGTLELPRGTVHFRNRDFEVTRGVIEFDDIYRIDPNFDVIAETTIRRTGDLANTSWRVQLRAHGNRDAFQLEMSSDPELSQEDIGLLVTLGMTRSEFDQLQQGDLGAVALDALATVTGVDEEVRRRVPIDEFQFTSAYSPLTGRTEPQVIIGKRVRDRVRVRATTGVGESREFRTELGWELGDQTSVEVVYDNINTTSSSPVGNVGVDLRWRLEFE